MSRIGPGGRDAPTGEAGPVSIEALNAAIPEAFVARAAPWFEGAPRFLARLAAGRPDATVDGLFARARSTAHAMPEPEQLELVDAHPRLGADLSTASGHARREQGQARGSAPSGSAVGSAPGIDAELAQLNGAYEARFGFRYCVFVAGRSRAALLPDLRSALAADRDGELHRALDAVVDIARSRFDRERAAR